MHAPRDTQYTSPTTLDASIRIGRDPNESDKTSSMHFNTFAKDYITAQQELTSEVSRVRRMALQAETLRYQYEACAHLVLRITSKRPSPFKYKFMVPAERWSIVEDPLHVKKALLEAPRDSSLPVLSFISSNLNSWSVTGNSFSVPKSPSPVIPKLNVDNIGPNTDLLLKKKNDERDAGLEVVLENTRLSEAARIEPAPLSPEMATLESEVVRRRTQKGGKIRRGLDTTASTGGSDSRKSMIVKQRSLSARK